MELNPTRFGIASGIVWGLTVFIMTWLAHLFGYGVGFLELLSSVYPKYDISPFGSILGVIYGFIDGFIGFFLLIWVYNKLGERTTTA